MTPPPSSLGVFFAYEVQKISPNSSCQSHQCAMLSKISINVQFDFIISYISLKYTAIFWCTPSACVPVFASTKYQKFLLIQKGFCAFFLLLVPLWGVKKFSWGYILACRYTFITSCIFFKYLYILCLVSKPVEGSNFLCAMENENIFPVDILRKIAVFLAHFSISYHQIWSTFCVWTKKYSFLLFWQELPNANP